MRSPPLNKLGCADSDVMDGEMMMMMIIERSPAVWATCMWLALIKSAITALSRQAGRPCGVVSQANACATKIERERRKRREKRWKERGLALARKGPLCRPPHVTLQLAYLFQSSRCVASKVGGRIGPHALHARFFMVSCKFSSYESGGTVPEQEHWIFATRARIVHRAKRDAGGGKGEERTECRQQ